MIVFDTETTGLFSPWAAPIAKQPHVTELFALKLDDNTLEEVGSWGSLFKPPVKISEEVIGITGITNEMVSGAPTFRDRIDDLWNFFQGESLIIAHNASYDRDVLYVEFRRADRTWHFPAPAQLLCTVEATEPMKGFRLSLTALHEELFSEKFPEAHRAENDVRALARCVVELKKRQII